MPTTDPSLPLLSVKDLSVSFPSHDGTVEAVRGISFSLARGATLGIVGESGSGKSVAVLSLIGLAGHARVHGQAFFDGRDLLAMPAAELRALRGSGIAMVFQSPMSSLHPLYSIGWQIVEMIRAHEAISRRTARARAVELLGHVGIPSPASRVDDYPHQYSGGMLQRAMIAMAIACSPRLLVADEPTTALDVTVQAQVLKLLRRLQEELGMAMILITHDLGVVAETAHDVLVMYAGRAMESASCETLLRTPHHPYTAALLGSRPRRASAGGRLNPIPGQAQSALDPSPGCPFAERCARAAPICEEQMPELCARGSAGDHLSACLFAEVAS